MADSTRTVYGTIPASSVLIRDADFDQVAENDLFPGPGTITEMSIDNTGNQAQQVYGKFYDSAAATIGTTAPNMIIPVAGGAIVEMSIAMGNGAVPGGYSFATGVCAACVITGGTAGAGGPTNPVVLALGLK